MDCPYLCDGQGPPVSTGLFPPANPGPDLGAPSCGTETWLPHPRPHPQVIPGSPLSSVVPGMNQLVVYFLKLYEKQLLRVESHATFVFLCLLLSSSCLPPSLLSFIHPGREVTGSQEPPGLPWLSKTFLPYWDFHVLGEL